MIVPKNDGVLLLQYCFKSVWCVLWSSLEVVDAFSSHLDQNSMSNAPFLVAVFGRSFVEFADFHYANNENPRRKISTIFE